MESAQRLAIVAESVIVIYAGTQRTFRALPALSRRASTRARSASARAAYPASSHTKAVIPIPACSAAIVWSPYDGV